jgi:flagellar L-ring protein precursor FlgH
MKKYIYPLISSVILMMLGGCMAGHRQTVVKSPVTSPAHGLMPVINRRPAEGALYAPGSSTTIVGDFRARDVGDVVTIIIKENLKGAKDVKTQTDRSSEYNLGLNGIFGLEFEKQTEPRYGAGSVKSKNAWGGSGTNKFSGSGKTSRDTSLSGSISARVIQVLPGGNLVIQGTRELNLNNETQYIFITGIARPIDIQPDNTINSTQIADARISYTGGGELSSMQSPGWVGQILNAFNPF